MTKVFDTYTRRTGVYYILWSIAIIPIVLFILTNAFSILQISPLNERYLGGLCALGLAVFFFFRNSFVKMYLVDGKLSFSDSTIDTGSSVILISSVKKIVIMANDYKGAQKGTSDGSGNRMEIHDQSDKVCVYRFIIKSYFEQLDLQKILAHYREMGIMVTSSSL